MSYYIKLSTLEYPRHIGDIWLEHPELKGQHMCPNTYAQVIETTPPEYNNTTHKLILDTPENINDIWYQTWKVQELSSEEINAIKEQEEVLNGPNL